jgi:hypothetical protein
MKMPFCGLKVARRSALECERAVRLKHGQHVDFRTRTAVAPETCRVKGLVAIALLFCATELAAAQDAVAPAAKGAKAEHKAEHASPRGARPPQPRRPPLPIAVPQQFSPPQEVYGSFPESVGAGAAPSAPQTPSACQLRLADVAVFKPIAVLAGPGECGAVDAVLLERVILPDQAKVAIAPPATLRCAMAEEVALWLREDVAPAALKLGAPLRGLDNFDSYECRGRNRVHGATLSEHGRANALDVGALRLANGEVIGLTDVNVAKDWREALRASACARFSTVLGPGSDGSHEQHIHVDLAERRGGYKMCEWEVRESAKLVEKTEPDAEEHTAELQEPVPLPRPRPAASIAGGAPPPAKKAHSQLTW